MRINEAKFIKSRVSPSECPKAKKPEYAFIGRSNVGKSSLLNMLCERKSLAKTSSNPGKTKLINHFLINNNWYMVDLPGYGYAKISKVERAKFVKIIENYLKERTNLINLFILVDSRHAPMTADIEFMRDVGIKNIPFSIVFTKTDKLKPEQLQHNLLKYEQALKEDWQELPPFFLTSATTGNGRKDLLQYIEEINKSLNLNYS